MFSESKCSDLFILLLPCSKPTYFNTETLCIREVGKTTGLGITGFSYGTYLGFHSNDFKIFFGSMMHNDKEKEYKYILESWHPN